MPARESIIRNGIYKDIPLSVLYREYPELFGTEAPVFPLLIKLIDAESNLSVQVHNKNGRQGISKNEAWLVLEADQESRIVLGARIETGKELREIISRGKLPEYLNYIEVRVGDVFYVPAGTLHAIGKGTVVYEIQQPSDITYRLFDYDNNRHLSIDAGCNAYDSKAEYGKVESRPLEDGNVLLLSSDFFMLEKITAQGEALQKASDRFLVYTALGNGMIIRGVDQMRYKRGDTFLIPAGYGEFRLQGGVLLKAYVTG